MMYMKLGIKIAIIIVAIIITNLKQILKGGGLENSQEGIDTYVNLSAEELQILHFLKLCLYEYHDFGLFCKFFVSLFSRRRHIF